MEQNPPLYERGLLQATHSHIGGGRCSFSMPSGTDVSSLPLQIFVQLVASCAHATNVLLQPTHLPGRYNEWADDLSRNRLAPFAHRPANRVRFSPAGLRKLEGASHSAAPWRPEHRPGMCDIWLASRPASERQ